MKTLIKWPGGKSREIKNFEELIPKFDRYVEPFFGGGAVFFHLEPNKAYINDISLNLIEFYRLVKNNNEEFVEYLRKYSELWNLALKKLRQDIKTLKEFYLEEDSEGIREYIEELIPNIENKLVLNKEKFYKILEKNVLDKFRRTKANEEKAAFSIEDLEENLITGFTSGIYMYFRDIYNLIALENLEVSTTFKIANFYFIREYCYGSMFRYNSKGEFNIPYGGASYNTKNFNEKINNIIDTKTVTLFEGTNIFCEDFENFLNNLELTENDFIFLDPPYDTEFSDYEGREFSLNDQERLCRMLMETPAKFLLVIKNTDFIYNLYVNNFNILSFDKNYSYNVRSRNERVVEHLIITNYLLNEINE